MTLFEQFQECTRGPWTNTDDYVTFKRVGKTIYFQCSKEPRDWIRNISFIPTVLHINGKKILTPSGYADAWRTIRHAFDWAEIDYAVGYSHGAVLAAYVSVLKNCPAILFGPPRFVINKRKLFNDCLVVKNPRDVVCMVPPFYRLPWDVNSLSGGAERGDASFFEWWSGHSASEYRQRLAHG
jgi:hypothetical protein